MIKITPAISIGADEVQMAGIRASGPGGQNVNKVSSAVHLRFDIGASSLPEEIKQRLLNRSDRRISRDGVIHIKAQNHRSQQMNRDEAVERLIMMIRDLTAVAKVRKPTRRTRGSNQRRLDSKSRRSRLKSTRGAVRDW